MRHGPMQNMCNNIFDVVRGMLIYTQDSDIGIAIDAICKEAEVVRIKERLQITSRTSEGWGDIMINFRLKLTPEEKVNLSVGTEDHICEIQLCRMEMTTMRKNLGGHEEYFWFRAALELHEVNDLPLPTEKLSNRVTNMLNKRMKERRFSRCSSLENLGEIARVLEDQLVQIDKQIDTAMEARRFKECEALQTSVIVLQDELRNVQCEVAEVSSEKISNVSNDIKDSDVYTNVRTRSCSLKKDDDSNICNETQNNLNNLDTDTKTKSPTNSFEKFTNTEKIKISL